MKPSNREHRRFTEDIRKKKERIGKQPWYKVLAKKIERLNKRLTYPIFGKLLHVRKRSEKIDPTEIKSVLFLRPDVIGDMICTTPLWRILKKQAPHLKIAVLASFRNAEVLRADTDVTRVHTINPYDKKQTNKTFEDIRRYNYDVVIICKLDRLAKAAHMASQCTKTGWTIGISIDPEIRHDLLFSMAPYMSAEISKQHMTDQLLFILEQSFKLQEIALEERRPSVMIDKEVFDRTKRDLEQILSANGSSEFIVINTQARNNFLEWGYDNTFALTKMIVERYPNMMIFLTSSPEREASLIEALRAANLGSKVAYYPTPDLHMMFSLIRLSTLVVTPDTSAIHMASAERKPTVGFYPRSTNWQPYRVPSYMLLPELDHPVRTIPVKAAFRAVKDLLDPSNRLTANNTQHIVQTSGSE
jgi:ADP-heptose:LPS heptosyltransferase